MSDGDKMWEGVTFVPVKKPTPEFCGKCKWEKFGAYSPKCHSCILNDIHYNLVNNFELKEVEE